MKRKVIFSITTFFLLVSFVLNAQDVSKDPVKYIPKHKDPVYKEMEAKNKNFENERQAVTDSIRNAQSVSKEKKKQEKKKISFDFTGVQKPASPDVFQSAFHFAPVRQFLTGDCWAFSTTSFFESEVYRINGKKIKLSEMHTVYYEYLEKARRFVQERGESYFDEGSEGNAVIMVWQKYGVVPSKIYKGELDTDGRYDHSEMVSEMKSYLKYVKENELWDEDLVLSSLRLIMNKYMGRPPETFKYKGKQITPPEFLKNVLKINLEDYICTMSTLAQPFYEYGEYEVELNWWHSEDYYNLPLDEFYGVINYAIQNGYTVRLNGDVSEPGYNGLEDAAIIPTFDIPWEYIDQNAREFRFNNKSTSDDHDIHLVGYAKVEDYDWYLIKDSAGVAQWGKYNGYLFYREDYIKLKMLTYIVHKNAVKSVIENFH